MNKKSITAIVVTAVLLVVIGIAYAALSATLRIEGTTTITKQTWDIEFTKLTSTAASSTGRGAQAVAPVSIDSQTTHIEWTTTLNVPGDFAEFVVTVQNKGSIDAEIADGFTLGNTADSSASNVVSYKVCYVDGESSHNYVKADGTSSETCVEPAKSDIYYGTGNVNAEAKKLGTRYVWVKVFYDPDKITESGSNLGAITSGVNDETNETENYVRKMNMYIPFKQYTPSGS